MKNLNWIVGALLVSVSGAAACTETFENDCTVSDTCPPDGDGDTGGSTSGGQTNGDGDTGGNTGDTGGTGGTTEACSSCSGETPACNDDDECVECTGDIHCEGPTPVCDVAAEECVGCNVDSDCKEATAPLCGSDKTCQACTDAGSCGDLGNQCLPSGECVECLSEDDCGGKVCDPDTNTCTAFDAGTEFACQECQYDAQCATGHVCVEMSYPDPMVGVVGSFCLWEKDSTELGAPNGSCGLASRPYAQEAAVTTINGASATVCRPRTTTCPAILQHATTVSGCETPGDDDAACGAAGFSDGRCRLNGSLEAKCSYPCLGTEDCQAGSTCPAAGDRFCSL